MSNNSPDPSQEAGNQLVELRNVQTLVMGPLFARFPEEMVEEILVSICFGLLRRSDVENLYEQRGRRQLKNCNTTRFVYRQTNSDAALDSRLGDFIFVNLAEFGWVNHHTTCRCQSGCGSVGVFGKQDLVHGPNGAEQVNVLLYHGSGSMDAACQLSDGAKCDHVDNE